MDRPYLVHKLCTHEKLLANIRNCKKEGKRIVVMSGSFDVLHVGHVRDLHEAKEHGDVLVVLLNSDTSVKLYKGPTRPIINEWERAEMLSALSAVDYITLFNEINPVDLIEKIKPDVFCNGSDWGKNCLERGVVERNGGRVHVLQWHEGFSSTQLIKRIAEGAAATVVRAIYINQDSLMDTKTGQDDASEKTVYQPRVIEALQILSQTVFMIIIISDLHNNVRGINTKEAHSRHTNQLVEHLKKSNIRIDRVYSAVHDSENTSDYRNRGIGILLKGVAEFGISLSKSWLIGNHPHDIVYGRHANIQTIKIGEKMPPRYKLEPHYYVQSLFDATKIILSQ